MTLKLHPACAAWPVMGETELAALAADIKATGLREPIVMIDDEVLDGRCRWLACECAGVDPRIRAFGDDPSDGNDPIVFVISKNKHRRHSTKGQISISLAELANLQQGSNRYETKKVDTLQKSVYSYDALGKLGDVSRSAIENAASLLKNGTAEVIAIVKAGSVPVGLAAEAVRATPREQQDGWTADDIKRVGKKAMDRYPSKQRKTAKPETTPGPPQSRRGKSRDFAGPRPTLRILSRDEAGEPSLEEWNQRAPGHPPGVTKGRLHVEKNGKVQLWSPADRALLELEGRARNFTACLRAILDPDGLEVPEIAGLTFKHGGEFRRSLRELLPRVEARLAAFAAAFLDEKTHETMDPAVAAC